MTTTPWADRPLEEARLLNPAFLGALLWSCARGYASVENQPQPYALSFLVAPIVLHKSTRDILPATTRTSLAAWLGGVPRVHLGFAERATALVPLVKEAILYSAHGGLIRLEAGQLRAADRPRAMARFERDASDEVKVCVKKAELVGKWFANSGDYTTVMALWGVAP